MTSPKPEPMTEEEEAELRASCVRIIEQEPHELLPRLLATIDAERAKRVELEAEMVPYCDVCGGDGESLRTAVEVCRDCYDANGMAAELAIAKRIAEWLRAEAERCQKAMGLYTVSEVLKFADDVERGDWRR